jgi:hypothetical protein
MIKQKPFLWALLTVSVIVNVFLLMFLVHKRQYASVENIPARENLTIERDEITRGSGGYGSSTSFRSYDSYDSIEELPSNLRQRIDELHMAMERDFTSLDGTITDFSFTDLTVPEAVRRLSIDYTVLCGIEVIPWPSSPEGLVPAQLKRVSMSLQQATPRQILDKLVTMDPTFIWFEDQGIANIAIRKAYESPDYPLNKRIPHFTVNDRPYTMVFGGRYLPALFGLPQVRDYLVFGSSGRWPREFEPRVSVDAVDATVRDIINQVARKVGMPWSAVLCETPSGEPWVSFHMHPRLPVPRCFQEPVPDANQP